MRRSSFGADEPAVGGRGERTAAGHDPLGAVGGGAGVGHPEPEPDSTASRGRSRPAPSGGDRPASPAAVDSRGPRRRRPHSRAPQRPSARATERPSPRVSAPLRRQRSAVERIAAWWSRAAPRFVQRGARSCHGGPCSPTTFPGGSFLLAPAGRRAGRPGRGRGRRRTPVASPSTAGGRSGRRCRGRSGRTPSPRARPRQCGGGAPFGPMTGASPRSPRRRRILPGAGSQPPGRRLGGGGGREREGWWARVGTTGPRRDRRARRGGP